MVGGVYIGQYCIASLTYFFITWFPLQSPFARLASTAPLFASKE